MQFTQFLNSTDYGMDKYYGKGYLCDVSVDPTAPAAVTLLLVSSNNLLFNVTYQLFKISVSVHLSCCIQDGIPCLIKACLVRKNICNVTLVKIRYLKVKVECVIQGMNILCSVNISLRRLESVFELKKESKIKPFGHVA